MEILNFHQEIQEREPTALKLLCRRISLQIRLRAM